MNNEELNHLARCEVAMKQARHAIALQLRRWRDGDSVCAVGELQNAYDDLADLVGEAKPKERLNKNGDMIDQPPRRVAIPVHVVLQLNGIFGSKGPCVLSVHLEESSAKKEVEKRKSRGENIELCETTFYMRHDMMFRVLDETA
jgi:hypothetical protein